MRSLIFLLLFNLILGTTFGQASDMPLLQDQDLKRANFLNENIVFKSSYNNHQSLNKDFYMTKKSKVLLQTSLILASEGAVEHFSEHKLNRFNDLTVKSGLNLPNFQSQQVKDLDTYVSSQEKAYLQYRKTIWGDGFLLNDSKIAFKNIELHLPDNKSLRVKYTDLKKYRRTNSLLYWGGLGLVSAASLFVINDDLRNVFENDRYSLAAISLVGAAMTVTAIIRNKKKKKLTRQFIKAFNRG